jgi:hypothetical protein
MIDLEFPFLPCIGVQGGGSHIYFFPLEVLECSEKDDLDATNEI